MQTTEKKQGDNAMDILEYIPYGKGNAVKREDLRDMLGVSDRDMRRMIAQARKDAPIINLSDGYGYYRPNDKDDLLRYILQEQARAKKILDNIRVACIEFNKITGQMTLGDLQ